MGWFFVTPYGQSMFNPYWIFETNLSSGTFRILWSRLVREKTERTRGRCLQRGGRGRVYELV